MTHLNGNRVSTDVSTLIEHWETIIDTRKTSSIGKLLYLIIGQPVINLKYLESKLGISLRASSTLMKRAIEYGILRPIGNEKRGYFYQSDAIISIMEPISSEETIRRNFQR